jgi:hypothetical protein
VHQGEPGDARPVFEELWPEARAVSDPHLELYDAFGVGRVPPVRRLHPGLARAGFRALRRGYRQTGVQGDPWRMPGFFLVEEERVVWRHIPAHAGDLPDFASRPWRGR